MLYCVSLMAYKTEDRVVLVRHSPMAVKASSKAEALGMGHIAIQRCYPLAEHWIQDVQVCPADPIDPETAVLL
jgi:hypothetical protein